MIIRRPVLILFVFVLSIALAAPLSAKQKKGSSAQGQGGISREQAAQLARKSTSGRVLSVKPTKDGYRVKILTPKGKVKHVPIRGGKR